MKSGPFKDKVTSKLRTYLAVKGWYVIKHYQPANN